MDKNHTGSISIQQAVKDPLFGQYIAFSLANNQNYSANVTTNTTDLGTLNKATIFRRSSSSNATARQVVDSTAAANSINIDKQSRPMLERTFEGHI